MLKHELTKDNWITRFNFETILYFVLTERLGEYNVNLRVISDLLLMIR